MTQANIKNVIVVGAGPVGLLTALFLGQKGIVVDVFEAENQVNTSPRGLAYGPAAVSVLKRAGILNKVIERGYVPADAAWRKPDGELLMRIDRLDVLVDDIPHSVVLPVGSLSVLLVEELEKLSSVSLHWGQRVTGLGQNDDQAWAEVSRCLEKGTEKRAADFIIGADGGNSVVRKTLLAGSFPGRTWPMQLVAVNVQLDFNKLGFSDIQWIVDPENWFVIARIDNKGLWRVVYGEPNELSVQEIRDRLPERFKTLPGHPKTDEYELLNVSPYVCHQRCAEKMRVGRVLLAGDAAHLNNPMGGLGLTTGISDVGSLADCLYGIHEGKADMSILDQYNEIRLKIFREAVDTMSTANFERIMQDANQFQEKEPFFKLISQAQKDPQLAQSLREHELAIGFDMTKLYIRSTSESSQAG